MLFKPARKFTTKQINREEEYDECEEAMKRI